MQATLTVLFTDAVASTEALARLGDERFEVVQREHLDLLRESVSALEGREVKSLGDGLMVAFTGAADALACAVGMQQAVEAAARRGKEGLPLRVGVSSGDVTVEDDGDVTGTAVVEAARLCAAAAAGQILGTETVRLLAGSRGGHVFVSLGPVELKGMAEAVLAVEVGWSPVAEAGGFAPVPLPPRLAFESAWAFVGRAGEVERLAGMWREVVGGVRVALLGGEPGAGKTRLAREISVRAHEQGALVLFGRVDEDLAVAYQPFAEALRHYLASVDQATRDGVLGLRGGVLTRLVPELVDEPVQGQAEAWTIFEALVDWLSGEAAQRPVVLVLDDVHWAAKPTLQALMHLVRSERLSRLLIVATYRDTELDRKHPLAEVLADLRRVDGVERIAVRGLDTDGVAAFVQSARGDELDDAARELAAMLSEQTQGNPFFVGQVLRHLAESGAVQQVDGRWVATHGTEEFVVPEGVREVVGRRVSRLSEQAGELLTVAAVTGPEFDSAIVAEVAGQPAALALDGFDEALASRLVLETDSPGRLRFAHALVRQTLEDELSTMRRLHLHQQIGLAIERRVGDAQSAVADLAHHFAEAAALGEGERAAHYAERAAVQALERGASDQATDLLDRALELLPADADPNGLVRDGLFQQVVHCDWLRLDLERQERDARSWLRHGQDLDDEIIQCNAATWLMYSFFGRVPAPDALAEFARALRLDLGDLNFGGRRRFSLFARWRDMNAASLRCTQLHSLANLWAISVPLEEVGEALGATRPLDLIEEAVRLAELGNDPDLLPEVLISRTTALVATPDAAGTLDDATTVVASGLNFGGGGWWASGIALARLGRLDDQVTNAERMSLAGAQHGNLLLTGNARFHQAMVALVRGDLDTAERATQEALDITPDLLVTKVGFGFQTVARLLAAGEPRQARSVAELLNSDPAFDVSHLVGVVAIAEGDLETPRAVLDAWHAAGHPVPVDWTRTGRLWGLAECAHATGDQDAARRLYDALMPYDGQFIVYTFCLIVASTAFLLGLLAETLGDRQRAVAHFTEALTFEEQCQAETLAARTRQALARIG